MNFSPFLAGSEGLVTAAGLAPPFSRPDVTAHNAPEPKENQTEMLRQMRIDLLNFAFIIPRKFKK